jgi:peptide/nickel transport system permease protein
MTAESRAAHEASAVIAIDPPARPEAVTWVGLLLRNRKALVGLVVLGAFVVMASGGALLVPYDPSALVALPHEAPSLAHWFGTTGQGQDVLSQTIAGARVSLLVAFATGLLVTFLGAVVGVAAAYFGGWVDDLLSLLTNVFLIMPGLPLAVIVAAYLPPGPWSILVVLVVTGWAWNARVLRAQALSLRDRDFVAAAIVTGEGPLRIMVREIVPNMASLLVSGFISATTYAIGAQVGLEFIGVGDLSRVTWGTNLYWASNDAALLTSAWWTIVPTGLAVAACGFALTLVNFGIDEITNPRLRAEDGWRDVARALHLVRGSATPVIRREVRP